MIHGLSVEVKKSVKMTKTTLNDTPRYQNIKKISPSHLLLPLCFSIFSHFAFPREGLRVSTYCEAICCETSVVLQRSISHLRDIDLWWAWVGKKVSCMR
jgi:hypothetical protein